MAEDTVRKLAQQVMEADGWFDDPEGDPYVEEFGELCVRAGLKHAAERAEERADILQHETTKPHSSAIDLALVKAHADDYAYFAAELRALAGKKGWRGVRDKTTLDNESANITRAVIRIAELEQELAKR